MRSLDAKDQRRRSQPWTPGDATREIRHIGGSDDLDLLLTKHVKARMTERGLQVDDLLHLLSWGFVYAQPSRAKQPADQSPRYWKYDIQGTTPNSDPRSLKAVVIPDPQRCHIKVVTVMWLDEPGQGSHQKQTTKTRLSEKGSKS